MILYKKIAIVGVGLIGGSIGLAAKEKGLAEKIIGIGHKKDSISKALKAGAIDEGYLDLKPLKDADLIILASPVKDIINILISLKKFISPDALIIDVGSTKSEILFAARKKRLNFIGCHPLAGMEKKGPGNARGGLFKDSLCLVVPMEETKKSSQEKISVFWKALGAKVKIIDAQTHDRILAYTSHLPHAVVYGLLDCLKKEYLGFAAGGLKDTTRIGLSDPLLWTDIFLTNRREILDSIKHFRKSLCRLESYILHNQPGRLRTYLESAKNKSLGFLSAENTCK